MPAAPADSPDESHASPSRDERTQLQAAQQHVVAQLAAVEAELAAARKAARTREVELLLDTRAKLHETCAKLHEQQALQLALQLEAARRAPLSSADATWTSSPFFSPALASIGLSTPWEQWGFFGSAAGGCIYATRQYFRAHQVVKFVETNNVEHLYMANVPSAEAARARFLITRFRVQGAAAAALSPLLWLAWRNARDARQPPGARGSGDAAGGRRE